MINNWNNDTETVTTVTEYEYDAEGRVVKETKTVITKTTVRGYPTAPYIQY